MKRCTYCGSENEDTAAYCHGCGSQEFEPKPEVAVQHPEQSPEPKPAAPDAVAVKEGNTMTLKCRTPREAFLVAEELEAADIITILPDTETLMQDYRRDGYVTVKVSAQAYEAAKELQYVIERRHWEERAQMPLPWGMKIAAICLPLILGAGWIGIIMIHLAYQRKGYERRKNQFDYWFLGGMAFWFLLLIVLWFSDVFG